MKTPDQFKQAAESAKKKGAVALTVREMLGWYGYSRRGSWIVDRIKRDLRRARVRTVPDWESVWIDRPIKIIAKAAATGKTPETNTPAKTAPPADATVTATDTDFKADEVSPSHRISRLEAAGRKPVFVKPSDRVETAVTLMMGHDFSQLPVMTSPGTVQGMISWRSIGRRLTQNRTCEKVSECIEPHLEVRDSASIFDVIRMLARHDAILVRGDSGSVTGIVTAADISEQFQKLSEPFLLLGDIEANLRQLVEQSFDSKTLQSMRDPDDDERTVDSAADLTFGEYVRLLENPEHWKALGLRLDRVVFRQQLDEVRRIRNDVMHFDPDGIAEDQLYRLRDFSRFIETAVSLLNG